MRRGWSHQPKMAIDCEAVTSIADAVHVQYTAWDARRNIRDALAAPPYKIWRRQATTRIISICTPEDYFDEDSRARRTQRRAAPEHKWVFDLIAGQATDEDIFTETADWVLCRDMHVGPEDRFLVVFKDLALHTIRELDHTHVPMLLDLQRQCRGFLQTRFGDESQAWRLYFNYMPSVLQLHLHVSRSSAACSDASSFNLRSSVCAFLAAISSAAFLSRSAASYCRRVSSRWVTVMCRRRLGGGPLEG
jgi:hypothetical protein